MRISSAGDSKRSADTAADTVTPNFKSLATKLARSLKTARLNAAAAQQIEQKFAATRRFGREQHPGVARRQMRGELGRRLLGARIDADCRRRYTRKVLHRPRRFGRPFEGAQLHLRPGGKLAAKFGRRQVEFSRVENRPKPVVAQLLVPLHDAMA